MSKEIRLILVESLLTSKSNRLESLITDTELPTQKVWVRSPEDEIIVTIGCDTLQNGAIESRVRSSCPSNKFPDVDMEDDSEVGIFGDSNLMARELVLIQSLFFDVD